MGDWIVTRHESTVDLVREKMGLDMVEVVPHLNEEIMDRMESGDRVFGVLPVHLIYQLKVRGVDYYAIVLPNIPLEKRGQELTVKELLEYGFRVLRVSELHLEEVDGGDGVE